ncbi:outer membrane beta-barrel protein [Pseudoalteromonas sp. SSDWG2]|uniref:outer membrane beta-barrel protein n=1 Tax=Pseudoalteromonas sp. SSDWG2 TaxID=3139391 RepID=UPI003BA91069
MMNNNRVITRTKLKPFGRASLISTVLLVVSTPALSAQSDEDKKWYVGGAIGYASSDASIGSIDRQFANVGLDASVTALDNSDMAVSLYLGYDFNQHWYLQGGYKDIGEVQINISATYDDEVAFFDEIRKIHPESGDGLFIALGYHFYINDDFTIAPQLGLFDWQGKFKTTNVGELKGRDKISGTDMFLGIKGEYRLSQEWRVGLSWERINFDKDESDAVWLSARYQF